NRPRPSNWTALCIVPPIPIPQGLVLVSLVLLRLSLAFFCLPGWSCRSCRFLPFSCLFPVFLGGSCRSCRFLSSCVVLVIFCLAGWVVSFLSFFVLLGGSCGSCRFLSCWVGLVVFIVFIVFCL